MRRRSRLRRSKVLALVICVPLAVSAWGGSSARRRDSQRPRRRRLLSAQTVSVRVAERDDVERLPRHGAIVTYGAKEVAR